MSILERSASPQVSAAESVEHSDRLSVITAGRVGSMDALLGTNGFNVVAVAQTEDALIDAVSAGEPDAIVVEADMCTSLEHVRDLAPDAVLIVVGDHTPAGALGRIERGVSGTVMAGLLHALVAEGIGGAVGWGLVPAFGPRSTMQVPQRISGWLLSGKGDLVRAYVMNALRDHTEVVTAATTVAVTISAGVLLTLSGPRTDERPARVPVPASAVERAPQEAALQEAAPQDPAFAVSPTTPTSTRGPSTNQNELSDRRGPNRGESGNLGRHDGLDENEHDQGDHSDNQAVNEGSDDQIVEESSDDSVVEEGNDPHGKNEDPHGKNEDPHGQNEDPHGQNEDDHGVNQDNDDQRETESGGDHAEDSDDQAEDEGNDDQGVDENDQVVEESNDDQGEATDPTAPL
jgi:hypothetical protein